jgi:uncharacterized protein Yka (UPF0111/DUF47 family)
MLSLQRILGQDKKFFDLLEASAEEGRASVLALKSLLAKPTPNPSLDDFSAARRKDKEITNQINDLLCTTFVTALEREDIEELANSLYKIPKTVEKFMERYLIATDRLKGEDFSSQIVLLEKATNQVIAMLKDLRASRLSELLENNAALQQVESEADVTIRQLYRQLFQHKEDPLKAIILKDLYELLEKVVDRCRTAGNVMARVAFKHT